MPTSTPIVDVARDVTSYGWFTYAWVVALSAWGGAVSFVRKVRVGETRAFNVAELIGEIVVSCFVGIITFWLTEAARIDPLYSAALIAISSHMGTRALFQFEQWASKRFLGVETMPPTGIERDK